MWRRATVCLDRDLDRTIHLLEACLDASWRIYAWAWVKPGHLLRVLPGAGPNPGVEEIAVEVVAADANRTELQVTSYSRVLFDFGTNRRRIERFVRDLERAEARVVLGPMSAGRGRPEIADVGPDE
jgi:hypothetical protein